MALSPAQQLALKADIVAKSAQGQPLQVPVAAGEWDTVAAYYNAQAAPDFFVWRTNVTRAELYTTHSDDNTDWDWTIYKGQSATEQNAWVQMFMGDQADFSKANLRSGIAKIFGNNNANNTHCLAVGRRRANRLEKLLATGTGTTGAPATMGVEGTITAQALSDLMSAA